MDRDAAFQAARESVAIIQDAGGRELVGAVDDGVIHMVLIIAHGAVGEGAVLAGIGVIAGIAGEAAEQAVRVGETMVETYRPLIAMLNLLRRIGPVIDQTGAVTGAIGS